ncbi:MAG: hypothetical protein FJ333_08480, partial [Sphingomonadales bacterium]|nr:hypothetical protein [Sphingomonadales bacterium]
MKADIILLSDVRIKSKNLVSNSDCIERVFRINPYRSYSCIFNSTQNKRGVGILLANNINFVEHARIFDPEENFLLIKVEVNGSTFIVGAVYGPNNTDKPFYDRLYKGILDLGNFPIVLGGDWNATPSIDKIEDNIDCLNMLSLPNLSNSKEILAMCRLLDLVEPY